MWHGLCFRKQVTDEQLNLTMITTTLDFAFSIKSSTALQINVYKFLIQVVKIAHFITFIARSETRGSSPLLSLTRWTLQDSRSYSDNDKSRKKAEVKLDIGPFSSQMDYRSRLQFNAPSLAYPLSGIVCTLGPASNKFEVILKLIQAGLRVVRMNFSHGSYQYHEEVLKAAQQAIDCYAKQLGVYKPVAIALDTRGPEIRTGQISGSDTATIELKQGDSIKLSTNKDLETKGTKEILYVNYENLPKIVRPSDMVFVDDGLIGLRVKEVSGVEVLCEILNSGQLGSRKGVNLPGLPVDLPCVSEKDKSDLLFGIEHNVDMVFASFIRSKNDVKEIRDVLGAKGKHIKLISKIENHQGMLNIDEIIEASDGILVARGDLGVDIPTENVLLAQKSLIAKCNKAGKPIICATQMLESMVTKPRPTRAEASDVGNAIFDGADCVMLSGETAKGKYPVECVKCMAKICAKTESVLWYEHIQNELRSVIKKSSLDGLTSVTSGIAEIAFLGQANAIIVVSYCPIVAKLLSQYRTRCAIIMLTQCPRIARQSVIYRGVFPIIIEEMANGCNDFATILSSGIKQMVMMKLVDVDKDVKLMTVDALQAKMISFRLLTIKQKSNQAKCQKTVEAQAKGLKVRSMKRQNLEKCKNQLVKGKTAEQIERCKKLAEKRIKHEEVRKKREETNNAQTRNNICKLIMSQAKKRREEEEK